jgi:ATP-dependent Clp protease protease subunit
MAGPIMRNGSPGESAGWPHLPGQPFPPRGPSFVPARARPDDGDWQGRVYERLLERRVVMAHGHLDDQAATLLCAQLLTLDATGDEPIRLQLQGLGSDLPAALTVIDAIDAAGAPVHAYVSGHLTGPALGILAAADRRVAYRNAGFRLAEPRVGFDGTAAELSARQQQHTAMLDSLYFRLAGLTGREVDEIRDDARRGRFLTAGEAAGYGLVEGVVDGSAGAGSTAS